MHQVYVHEHDGHAPTSPADLPKPCDYFDVSGGTYGFGCNLADQRHSSLAATARAG